MKVVTFILVVLFSSSWKNKQNHAAGFSIGDKGYLGVGNNLHGTFTNDFWEYDVMLNKWHRKADFGGVGRTEAVALGISSLKRGYLGFGYGHRDATNITSVNDFWEYILQWMNGFKGLVLKA